MSYKPTVLTVDAGGTGFSSKPAFLAHLATGVTNVTGDGTNYTIIYDTKDFDLTTSFNIANGIFTAPVTGKYLFNLVVSLTSSGAATNGVVGIITSARSYVGGNCSPSAVKSSGGVTTMSISVIANMTAADTASTTVLAAGTTKSVGVAGSVNTYFSGALIA